MKLSDRTIRERLALPDVDPGRLRISPFREPETEVNPAGLTVGLTSAGYDFTLMPVFLVPVLTEYEAATGVLAPVDPCTDVSWAFQVVCADAFDIPPGTTVLGCTEEEFVMPEDVDGTVVGRSTYARVGLNLNCTPIEPGWESRITLELSNTSNRPITVHARAGIGQLQFDLLTTKSDRSYAKKKGRYQGQTGPTLPIPRKRRTDDSVSQNGVP